MELKRWLLKATRIEENELIKEHHMCTGGNSSPKVVDRPETIWVKWWPQ